MPLIPSNLPRTPDTMIFIMGDISNSRRQGTGTRQRDMEDIRNKPAATTSNSLSENMAWELLAQLRWESVEGCSVASCLPTQWKT